MEAKKQFNYNISFAQMNQLGKEILSKQPKLTLEEVLRQVQYLKQNSQAKEKKQKPAP